jgi:soluble lytic murein transglycosylase-like protein
MPKLILILIATIFTIKLDYIEVNSKPNIFNIIYSKIIRNKPSIDKDYARVLAGSIIKYSLKYNISPIQYNAMLAQESYYELGAVNLTTGDYGLSQINRSTAEAYGLNTGRLLKDIDYSVEAGLIVLADFKKRYGNKEEDYWSRYNSSNKQKRTIYKKLVVGYM